MGSVPEQEAINISIMTIIKKEIINFKLTFRTKLEILSDFLILPEIISTIS